MEIHHPDAFRAYHARIHERTARLLPLVPDEDFDWAPAPGRFSFADLFRHLAATERYLFVALAAGEPNRYPGHGRELADGPEAVRAYYAARHAESRELLAALPASRLEERCVTPSGAAIGVATWLRAMIEHEVHHRGQLYLMLGLRGVATPPVFGLTSEEVRAAGEA